MLKIGVLSLFAPKTPKSSQQIEVQKLNECFGHYQNPKERCHKLKTAIIAQIAKCGDVFYKIRPLDGGLSIGLRILTLGQGCSYALRQRTDWADLRCADCQRRQRSGVVPPMCCSDGLGHY